MNYYIDWTDLINWKNDYFTGIQRVIFHFSIELIKNDSLCSVVFFSKEDKAFFEVDKSSIHDELGKNWNHAKIIRTNKMIEFNSNEKLVLLGGTWNQKEMISHLQKLKESFDFEIIHIIYDISPITVPQFHKESFPSQMKSWVKSILRITDRYLFISEFSKTEFLEYTKSESARSGLVIKLGSEKIGTEKSDIRSKDYILSVGTIEPRKNHLLIYYAWKLMLQNGQIPPKIIIVGNNGWNSDMVLSLLVKDPLIKEYIEVKHNTTDSELDILYRNCLFTVFPSYYEGWGLPVSESISYGKYCLSSREASMPEIAGNLIEYFEPLSSQELAEKVTTLYNDRDMLKKRTKNLLQNYKGYTWKDQGVILKDFIHKN